MRFKLVPTNDVFFTLFVDAARNVAEAAKRLRDLVTDYTDVSAKYEGVVDCERRGDEITRDILHRLAATFVTPFDREDVHALAEELDDVADDILAVADLLQLLPFDEILPEAAEFAELLVRMTEQGCEMLERFESMKGLAPYLDAIDKLESEGDAVYRRTIARLFRDYDAMTVLKWKDVFEAFEAALNRVEDISDVVEAIVLKHA